MPLCFLFATFSFQKEKVDVKNFKIEISINSTSPNYKFVSDA